MRRLLLLIGGFLLIFGSLTGVAASGPDLNVTAPADGVEIEGQDVTVAFQVTDLKLVRSPVPLDKAGKQPEANRPGEGHLHFMLDLQPVVVWEKEDAYTFTNVAPGDHQLMVELVNNDHSPLSPPVVRHIQFKVLGAKVMPETGTGSALHSAVGRILVICSALLLVSGSLIIRRRYMGHSVGKISSTH